MSCAHHPPDELLVDHVSGALAEAYAVGVATHLALCPACRARIPLLEEIGGALLAQLEPAPIAADRTRLLLERVAGLVPDAAPAVRAPAPEREPVLPEPLRSIAGGDVDALRWRFKAPGAREVVLPLSVNGVPARLVRLRRGMSVPRHTHSEPELSLVLSGGFRDESGVFERGDLTWFDASVSHSLRVLPDEPCVCLFVNGAKLVPLTLYGRLASKLVEI